jgi:hypothetical protein
MIEMLWRLFEPLNGLTVFVIFEGKLNIQWANSFKAIDTHLMHFS